MQIKDGANIALNVYKFMIISHDEKTLKQIL